MCHLSAMPAGLADLQEEGFMVYKVFAAGVVAVLLMCGPVTAMEEKDARASEWLSQLWSDLGAWLDGMAADGGCWIDPMGGCSQGGAPPPPQSEAP